MKVMLVNGSPHEKGCTYTALAEVAKALQKQGVETEIFHIGKQPIAGCLGCGACAKLGKCVTDDIVTQFIEKAKTADGFVFGSPVYYSSAAGNLVCFMDRLFYSGGKYLAYKPAAAVASARRAGTVATFDVLNKYFTINNMPVVSANYWNGVHGANNTPADVEKDGEGLQTMRMLGNNMAWLLQCIQLGKQAGIAPEKEQKIRTNFIR
ncbi:MAG: flavodoxin family protein [Clostridia bacterium]|nr:flavodoxin family protein [Clostridia bacterium]